MSTVTDFSIPDVSCLSYARGLRISEGPLTEGTIKQVRARGGFTCTTLRDPDEEELSVIAKLFGLHSLAVEDALHAHQRPKLEQYDEALVTVFKTVHQDRRTSQVGEIMVFTGRDFTIVVEHGGHNTLALALATLERKPQQLSKGPSAVLYAVAERVVAGYLTVIDTVRSDVERVENAVFATSPRPLAEPERIYGLKRQLTDLKRAVTPLLSPLSTLTRTRIPLIAPELHGYFRDAGDQLASASEQIADIDDLLETLADADLAQVTLSQNAAMRKLSAWLAIFAIPTMVYGFYGMNFSWMPETHWAYGYGAVHGTVALTCLAVHRAFRRRGWL